MTLDDHGDLLDRHFSAQKIVKYSDAFLVVTLGITDDHADRLEPRPTIAVGQPAASMVTVAPLSCKVSSKFWIAVISLLFASTSNCLRLIKLAEAQARIMWMADLWLALSKLPRSVLPSIAINCPSVASWSACIQLSRQRSNSAGDSIEKIALNRSCEGPRAQVEDLSEPSPHLPTEVEDHDKIVGTADHGADRDDDKIDERVVDFPTAGIGKRREMDLNLGAHGLGDWYGRSSMKIAARPITEAPSETSQTGLPNHAR